MRSGFATSGLHQIARHLRLLVGLCLPQRSFRVIDGEETTGNFQNMTFNKDVVEAIGNTPLIKLKRASEQTGCTILGKAEFMNPGQSVKDRPAREIILQAEKRGDIKRHDQLARRLRPFMLRRTKAEVASDLPPKTDDK